CDHRCCCKTSSVPIARLVTRCPCPTTDSRFCRLGRYLAENRCIRVASSRYAILPGGFCTVCGHRDHLRSNWRALRRLVCFPATRHETFTCVYISFAHGLCVTCTLRR